MNDESRIVLIDYRLIDTVWKDIVDRVVNAADFSYGKYTADDIYCFVRDRNMQLWLIVEGERNIKTVFITSIVDYPQKRVLALMFIAGEMKDGYGKYMRDFESFALEMNCQAIEGYGREGWKKIAGKLGFKHIHAVYNYAIGEGVKANA